MTLGEYYLCFPPSTRTSCGHWVYKDKLESNRDETIEIEFLGETVGIDDTDPLHERHEGGSAT
jgi:hypothetical protein